MNRAAWQYFCRFFRHCRLSLVLNLLVATLQSLTFLPILILVRRIFDTAIHSGKLGLLAWYCAAIVALILFNMGLTLWTRRRAIRVVKQAMRDLRDELVQRCLAFSRTYYSQADINHLRFTIIQDTDRLDIMSVSLLSQAIPAFLVSLTLSLLLVVLSWFLFLALAGIASLTLWIAWRMKKDIATAHERYRRIQREFGRGIALLLQIMDLIVAQAAEPLEIERKKSVSDSLRTDGERLDWLKTTYLEFQNTIITATGVVILFIGGAAVVSGGMSLGGLMSFYFLTVLLGSYLKNCWSSLPLIISGNEALKGLDEIVHSSDCPPYSGRRQVCFQGHVTLEAVSFGYGQRMVLQDTNMMLGPGRTVVIAGRNGSGKSTIAHLLLGFYRPQSGTLYADGIAYDQLDLPSLRRHMGLVPQNPIIFPGTIRENITYGNPEAPLPDIVHASRLATAHDFISLLPGGYETWVGENGMLLSGGQRQRIAIARALLRRPMVLILDEPTNHLDHATVDQLMENLQQLEFSPAILLISPKPETRRQTDQTFYLQEGHLVEFHPGRLPGEEGN